MQADIKNEEYFKQRWDEMFAETLKRFQAYDDSLKSRLEGDEIPVYNSSDLFAALKDYCKASPDQFEVMRRDLERKCERNLGFAVAGTLDWSVEGDQNFVEAFKGWCDEQLVAVHDVWKEKYEEMQGVVFSCFTKNAVGEIKMRVSKGALYDNLYFSHCGDLEQILKEGVNTGPVALFLTNIGLVRELIGLIRVFKPVNSQLLGCKFIKALPSFQIIFKNIKRLDNKLFKSILISYLWEIIGIGVNIKANLYDNQFAETLKLNQGRTIRILDVACGKALAFVVIEKYFNSMGFQVEYYGIDNDPSEIEIAKSIFSDSQNAQFICGDIRDIGTIFDIQNVTQKMDVIFYRNLPVLSADEDERNTMKYAFCSMLPDIIAEGGHIYISSMNFKEMSCIRQFEIAGQRRFLEGHDHHFIDVGKAGYPFGHGRGSFVYMTKQPLNPSQHFSIAPAQGNAAAFKEGLPFSYEEKADHPVDQVAVQNNRQLNRQGNKKPSQLQGFFNKPTRAAKAATVSLSANQNTVPVKSVEAENSRQQHRPANKEPSQLRGYFNRKPVAAASAKARPVVPMEAENIPVSKQLLQPSGQAPTS